MSEFIKPMLEFIPWYLTTLLQLATAPKRFIAQRMATGDTTLKDGLIFWSLSVLIGLVLTSLSKDLVELSWLATRFGISFLLLLSFGAAVVIAFRAVQGRADLQKMAIVHLYFFSMLELCMAITFTIMVGEMKVLDRSVFKAVVQSSNGGDPQEALAVLSESSSLPTIALSVLCMLVVVGLWLLFSWGAYRELNGLPRWRSSFAFVIFMLCCVPVIGVNFLIANALSVSEEDLPDAKASATASSPATAVLDTTD